MTEQCIREQVSGSDISGAVAAGVSFERASFFHAGAMLGEEFAVALPSSAVGPSVPRAFLRAILRRAAVATSGGIPFLKSKVPTTFVPGAKLGCWMFVCCVTGVQLWLALCEGTADVTEDERAKYLCVKRLVPGAAEAAGHGPETRTARSRRAAAKATAVPAAVVHPALQLPPLPFVPLVQAEGLEKVTADENLEEHARGTDRRSRRAAAKPAVHLAVAKAAGVEQAAAAARAATATKHAVLRRLLLEEATAAKALAKA
jgi:hypothetical protein